MLSSIIVNEFHILLIPRFPHAFSPGSIVSLLISVPVDNF
jgi:hypothetical protein